MGLRLIRGNSDTPNVTNADDTRMVRYAYGGYNGYVQGKGRELHCEPNGRTLTINSGVIVLQGWEVEIDSNGWSMEISQNDTTKRYFTVYCEVNLSLGAAADIKSTYAETEYPPIKEGDDLTETPNGVARIVLCHFTAQNGLISNVEKVINPIKYEFERMQDLVDGNIIAKKAEEAENSKKVNGLQIKEESSLLKVETAIVPKKYTIWSGEVALSNVETQYPMISLSNRIEENSLYEICCKTRKNVNAGATSENGFPVLHIKREAYAARHQNTNTVRIFLAMKYMGFNLSSDEGKINIMIVQGNNSTNTTVRASFSTSDFSGVYLTKIIKIVE